MKRSLSRHGFARSMSLVSSERRARSTDARRIERRRNCNSFVDDQGGLVPIAPFEASVKTELIEEWVAFVQGEAHWVSDVLNLPCAWPGAIDSTAHALAQTSYTLRQVYDFVARYRFSAFGELAAPQVRDEAHSGAEHGCERPS